MRDFFRQLDYLLKCLVAVTCGYETFAIVKDDPKFPTVSTVSGKYPLFGSIVLITLGVHFWWHRIRVWLWSLR